MRFIRSLALGSSLLLSTALAFDLPTLFQNDLNVITTTDVTPAGALVKPGTPEEPVYYVAINVGYHDFSESVMGGDKVPPSKEAIQTITNILAKYGYRPANTTHLPTQLVLWTWGTLNPTYDPNQTHLQTNRHQLLSFLGAEKVGLSIEPEIFHGNHRAQALSFQDSETDAIYGAASQSLFVISLAGYDFEAASRKEHKMLWKTKIACPSTGFYFKVAFPTMLTLAGPNIGRPTLKPVVLKASDKLKAEVKFGELQMVEYIDKDQLPVVDISDEALKNIKAEKKE